MAADAQFLYPNSGMGLKVAQPATPWKAGEIVQPLGAVAASPAGIVEGLSQGALGATGDPVSVRIEGVVEATAGATIAVGALVDWSAAGPTVVATTGGDFHMGVAVTGGDSGDKIQVLLNAVNIVPAATSS